MSGEKSCKTCDHGYKLSTGMYRCTYEIPKDVIPASSMLVRVDLGKVIMGPNEGGDCPVWKGEES